MTATETRDYPALRRVWRRNPLLHIYELGDLDPGWREDCRFFIDTGQRHAAVLFARHTPSVLLLFADPVDESACGFLSMLSPMLPDVVSAHLSLGLGAPPGFSCGAAVRTLRMGRTGKPDAPLIECETLGRSDLPALRAMLEASSPNYYLEDDAMLTGVFRGVRNEKGKLIAAGGVHVLSEAEGVASLGNIAVREEHRGRGLGYRVILAVLQALSPSVAHIGLNVDADRTPAIGLYRKLGFELVGAFEIAELRRQIL